MKTNSPILLVGHSEEDATIVHRALQDIHVKNELIHLKNGPAAMNYLLNQSKQNPGIILLDLNTPEVGGIEFLRERIKHESLRIIPVVVLSTSIDDNDKLEGFRLNVAGYMLKPVNYEQFLNVIRAINNYWSLSETAVSE